MGVYGRSRGRSRVAMCRLSVWPWLLYVLNYGQEPVPFRMDNAGGLRQGAPGSEVTGGRAYMVAAVGGAPSAPQMFMQVKALWPATVSRHAPSAAPLLSRIYRLF